MLVGNKVLVQYNKLNQKYNQKYFEAVLKSKEDNGTWTVIWICHGKYYGTITTGVKEDAIIEIFDEQRTAFLANIKKLNKKVSDLQQQVSDLNKQLGENFSLKILPFMANVRLQGTESRNLLDAIHGNQLLNVDSIPAVDTSVELSSVDLTSIVLEDP